MTVKPELLTFQKQPPAPVRVILDNDGTKDELVDLSLKVAGAARNFKVGNKQAATTSSAAKHTVNADALFDDVWYLHDWGTAKTGDQIEVTVTLNGVNEHDVSRVI